jgi:hypothetical protein
MKKIYLIFGLAYIALLPVFAQCIGVNATPCQVSAKISYDDGEGNKSNDGNLYGTGEYVVIHPAGRTTIMKPFIIIEGFDYTNENDVVDLYEDIYDLLVDELVKYDYDPKLSDF